MENTRHRLPTLNRRTGLSLARKIGLLEEMIDGCDRRNRVRIQILYSHMLELQVQQMRAWSIAEAKCFIGASRAMTVGYN